MAGLKAQLLARMISKEVFRIPIQAVDLYRTLLASYEAEVAARSRAYLANDEVKRHLWKIARILTEGPQKGGIMLNGLYGNGKTTTVRALAAALNYLRDTGAYYGDNLGIVIADAKDIAALATDRKALEKLSRKPCALAIEDMGREPAEVMSYGNVLSPIADLVETRYALQLYTIVTTNLTPAQISERYGPRIADRFREMLHVLTFKNPSFR